jgi:hypothetical protein
MQMYIEPSFMDWAVVGAGVIGLHLVDTDHCSGRNLLLGMKGFSL